MCKGVIYMVLRKPPEIHECLSSSLSRNSVTLLHTFVSLQQYVKLPIEAPMNIMYGSSSFLSSSNGNPRWIPLLSSQGGYSTTETKRIVKGFPPKPQQKCQLQEKSIRYQTIIMRSEGLPFFCIFPTPSISFLHTFQNFPLF